MARVSLRRCSRAVRSNAGPAATTGRGGGAAAGGEGGCLASGGASVEAISGCEVFRGDGLDGEAPACDPGVDKGGAAAAPGAGLVSDGLTGGVAAGGALSVCASGAEEG